MLKKWTTDKNLCLMFKIVEIKETNLKGKMLRRKNQASNSIETSKNHKKFILWSPFPGFQGRKKLQKIF